MIIDGHAHIWDSDFGNVNVLLAQLDEAGIDRALCVPGGMIDVRQFSRLLSGQLKPKTEIPNHLVFSALKAHPDRLYGLVCINPCEPDAALQTMQEGFERGCRGVKLAPLVHGCSFTEPVLENVAQQCGEHGFIVYTHVVPRPGATTADFAALARRCPGTNFVIGHMGFGPGDVDAIEFAAELPNFHLETSLGNYLIIRDALARLGPQKLMFGSEFPLSHPKVELEKIRLLDPSSHAAIMCDNVLRLIGAA